MGRKGIYDTPSRKKAKIKAQRLSNARRVRIGDEKTRWDALKTSENLGTDTQVARFLLDR